MNRRRNILWDESESFKNGDEVLSTLMIGIGIAIGTGGFKL